MGLDMYLYKIRDKELYEEIEKREFQDEELKDDLLKCLKEEVYYWRNDYDLQSWFIKNIDFKDEFESKIFKGSLLKNLDEVNIDPNSFYLYVNY